MQLTTTKPACAQRVPERAGRRCHSFASGDLHMGHFCGFYFRPASLTEFSNAEHRTPNGANGALSVCPFGNRDGGPWRRKNLAGDGRAADIAGEDSGSFCTPGGQHGDADGLPGAGDGQRQQTAVVVGDLMKRLPGAIDGLAFDAQVTRQGDGDFLAEVLGGIPARHAFVAMQLAVANQAKAFDRLWLGKAILDPPTHRKLQPVVFRAQATIDTVTQLLGLAQAGGQRGAGGQGRYGPCSTRQELVIIQQQALQFREVLLIDATWRGAMADGQRGGGADGLTHGGASGHHAGGTHRHMGARDIAPGKEQVGDIGGIQAAIGDSVG